MVCQQPYGTLALNRGLLGTHPAPQRRHPSLGPGFINEHRPGRIDPTPILGPLRPPADDSGTVLLGDNQRHFLEQSFSAWINAHIVGNQR